MQRRTIILAAEAAICLTMTTTCAQAVTIDSASVTNTSSTSDTTPPTTFDTQSTLSPVVNTATSSTLVHRMAFVNTMLAAGTPAQVHKGNVVYQFDFSVQDPTNQGFQVDLKSFLYGISSITQTSDGGTAFATGANFLVTVDDSTDAPDTYENLLPLFNGTDGVTITGMTSATAAAQNTELASLGAFVGTTSFSLRFQSINTPATNILLGNFQTGFGEVDYGLGSLAPGLSLDPDDLGHFVTVSVTFVPEPSTIVLSALGLVTILFTPRRKRARA